ncbi:MAG: DUF2079 domain-containing protein [Elusimicrobiota bacterium]
MLCFLKYCQYRGCQLPEDTAVMTQRAFNTSQGRWFQTGIYGTSYFAIHFAFVMDLLSPVLWVWRSALPLLLIQCLALGSMGMSSYLLARRASDSAYIGLLVMLLVYSCPAYGQLSSASLNDGVFLAPFLLWALVFMERSRWAWAAFFFALAAATREHFPVSVAALALYFVFREGRPSARRAITGGIVIVAAVLLLGLQLKLIGSFPAEEQAWTMTGFPGYDAAERTPFFEIIRSLLRHPWTPLAKIVYPPARLCPLLGLIAGAAFFPLAAPAQFLAFCVAVTPQMMMPSGNPLHDMVLQYPSLVFGLLIFAASFGAARVYKWLKDRKRQSWLLPAVLLVCGLNFKNFPRFLLPNWRLHMFDAIPRIVSKIPPDASLWTDEWLSAWVSTRAQLKLISFPGTEMSMFSRKLFKPEFVLVQKGWIIGSDPNSRDPIILFLAEGGYVKISDEPDLILLQSPGDHRAGLSPPAEVPAPSQAQRWAIQDITHRLMVREQQGVALPVPALTLDQQRLEKYCVYLLLTNS